MVGVEQKVKRGYTGNLHETRVLVDWEEHGKCLAVCFSCDAAQEYKPVTRDKQGRRLCFVRAIAWGDRHFWEEGTRVPS